MRIHVKPEHSSLDWKLQRWKDENGFCVLGASDAPALMNASPYKTRADLFIDKTTPPTEDATFNDAFYRGNILEPSLVQHAMNELKIDLVTPDVVYRNGRWSISMDAVDVERAPTIGVECKTTTRYRIETADDLPAEWRWQGYAQMAVLNVPIFFSVLDAGQRLRLVELERNQEAIDLLNEQAEEFADSVDRNVWIGHINSMTAEQIAMFAEPTEEPVELGEDALTWIATLEEARTMKRQGEFLEKEAKDHIARMLQGGTRGVVNGVPVVSWKEHKGKESLDVEALREAHPDLVAQFMRSGRSYRVMRLVTKAHD